MVTIFFIKLMDLDMLCSIMFGPKVMNIRFSVKGHWILRFAVAFKKNSMIKRLKGYRHFGNDKVDKVVLRKKPYNSNII